MKTKLSSYFLKILFIAFGILTFLIVIALSGYRIPFLPSNTEVTNERPYSDIIGREYKLIGNVSAQAWNDYPDKQKILVITLTPPAAKNRFVSYTVPLQVGQKIKIVKAWKSFTLFDYDYWYEVDIPGAGLPESVPVKLRVDSEGVLDSKLYELITKDKP